ncbi:MAG: hypothetical protein KDC35_20410 [Acidobacteria bacterium]|nr:hypothetical protein [Acidobacteriota bacterium]
MSLFSFRKNTIKFPEFTIGVFGKLPFYKDFLYSSFDKSYSDLRDAFDQGFDTLIRSQADRPYVLPSRGFLVHMPKTKVDLVGCIWESDDGLRGFPFMMACVFPRKLKSSPFHIFWQALEAYWKYFNAYYQDLKAQENPGEFYKRVRGIVHALPSIEAAVWEPEPGDAIGASVQEGFLTPVDLTGKAPFEEAAILRSIALKDNPSFVLWPSKNWAERDNLSVTGYLGSNGLVDLRFTFFLPERMEETTELDGDETAELELAKLTSHPNHDEVREALDSDEEADAETLRISRALAHAKEIGALDDAPDTAQMETKKSEDDIETTKMPIDRDQYK